MVGKHARSYGLGRRATVMMTAMGEAEGAYLVRRRGAKSLTLVA